MANPQKRKGDAAEREAAELLTALLGITVRRQLGAGRTTAAGGDTGDLVGVPAGLLQSAGRGSQSPASRSDRHATALLEPPAANGTRFCCSVAGGV